MAKQNNDTSLPASFEDATGPISVTLKNDMMFHCVMSRSKAALKGLVCALKGFDPKDVRDVTLMNPIDYSMYTAKEIILDVKVELNNSELMDIELQMYKDMNWEERSLLYLCRTFDCLDGGEDYNKLKPTTMIAIMDDPLFKDFPEFYSHYELLNIENHQPYSSMLNLNVLYLNRTDLATEEDRANNLVYWAELFKANTWENLKALCSDNSVFKEVAKIMYGSNVQSQEKTIFEAHQKYLLDKRSLENSFKRVNEELEETKIQLEEKDAQLEAKNAEIDRLKKLLAKAGIPEESNM